MLLTVDDRRLRMTEAEFLALPESNEHIELVDGEVVFIPGPTLLHQLLVKALLRALDDWSREHPPALAASAPLDVRRGPARILQPDLVLWRQGLVDRSTPIQAAPTLCVEILSKNATYDRIAKRLLYAEGGVLEYWLVDPATRTVEVVRGLETVAMVGEVLRSAELPGFSLDVASLFPGE
jgi:Uma2 family endonuclease